MSPRRPACNEQLRRDPREVGRRDALENRALELKTRIGSGTFKAADGLTRPVRRAIDRTRGLVGRGRQGAPDPPRCPHGDSCNW